jgi:hypothetical protein
MYRYEVRFEVSYGRARDLLKAAERLRVTADERGWQAPVLWNVSFGAMNVFVLSTDYPTLAAFDAEYAAQLQDSDWMNAQRQITALAIQGSALTELRETIGSLA